MSIIENSSHTKFFGEHYLQILQRNILQSKSNLIEIKVNEWSRILSYCFKLLECRSHSINSSLIGNCTASVIEIGTNNSHLGVDLYQYLPLLVNLLEGCPNGKFQNEIIKICYLCCKNVCKLALYLITLKESLFSSSLPTIDLLCAASRNLSWALFSRHTRMEKTWMRNPRLVF